MHCLGILRYNVMLHLINFRVDICKTNSTCFPIIRNYICIMTFNIKCFAFVTGTGGVCNNAQAGCLSAVQEPSPLQ